MTVGRWVGRMSWLVSVLTAVFICGALLAGCGESPQVEKSSPADEISGETIPEDGTVTAYGGSAQVEKSSPADEIWAEIIPEDGAVTAYGMPLSLDNTQQLIDWYYSISLSTDEQAVAAAALGSLPAPCCDDFPILTC